MTVIPLAIHVPENLWHAVQALATHEGDANTVILRALEEYITAMGKRLDAGEPVRARSSAISQQWTHGPRYVGLRTPSSGRGCQEGGAQWTNCSKRYPCRSLRSAWSC
jgi:hypothetical protein